MINDHVCHALVDTGSVASLVTQSFVRKLGVRIDSSRTLPLRGITAHPVPVLGTVYLDVFEGRHYVQHMFMVVPDNILDTELLLGVDLLALFPFTWDAPNKTMSWNGITYKARMLRHRPTTKRVRKIKLAQPSSSAPQLQLKTTITIPPNTTGLYPVHSNITPNTLLYFQPHNKYIPTMDLCLEVPKTQELVLPLVNKTKNRIMLTSGTLLQNSV